MSDSAQEYVRGRGGAVYVSAQPHRCCTGPLTLLDASTDGRGRAGETEVVRVGDIDVRWLGGGERPAQLSIELRGRLWPRLIASWNGCAYKL